MMMFPSYEYEMIKTNYTLDSKSEIVSKEPFKLKYISGVVLKAKIINEEKIDYYRQILPISIKTYLNSIKWCCIFSFLYRFRKNCSPYRLSVYEDMYNIALRGKHQDCIEYIDNCYIDGCQTFSNYKTARAWKLITCFGMRREILPNRYTHRRRKRRKR